VTCSSAIHRKRIIAFQVQQWLHERATMLRYTYSTFLVKIYLRLRFLSEEIDLNNKLNKV
jgi:hypothetical protein